LWKFLFRKWFKVTNQCVCNSPMLQSIEVWNQVATKIQAPAWDWEMQC